MINYRLLTKTFMSLGFILVVFCTTYSQSITSFTLYDANSDTSLFDVNDEDTINFQMLPTQALNINANTNGSIGSVIFFLNGNTKSRVTIVLNAKS